MDYDGYIAILKYSNKVFMSNLENIIFNRPIIPDQITKKFLQIIDILNHQVYIIDIAEYLLKHLLVDVYEIHTNFHNINIKSTDKSYRIFKHYSHYPSLIVNYKNKRFELDMTKRIKSIIMKVESKWKI